MGGARAHQVGGGWDWSSSSSGGWWVGLKDLAEVVGGAGAHQVGGEWS